MKISVVAFTKKGTTLCKKIEETLRLHGHLATGFTMEKFCMKGGLTAIEGGISHWTKEHFCKDAMVFVGATGIAVRAIAPYVKDKTTDPAVLVVDELGRYVISLLSGHIGGGNDLATSLAHMIGATPIISTATDLNEKFAVDVFATKNGLWICEMPLAKEISAAVLEGEVSFSSTLAIKGCCPKELTKEGGNLGVYVGLDETAMPYEHTLHLIPRVITLGIGCKRGTSKTQIEQVVTEVLKKYKISSEAILQVATIDLKQEEEGLMDFCGDRGLEMQVFCAKELMEAKGEFTSSAFVKGVTGVDNVCERSSVLASGGQLIVKKQAKDGVTVAVAIKEREITFEY